MVGVVHRGFGDVWFARAEHPGRVGQSIHGSAKKGHFPFGQRLPGGELAGGAISGGDGTLRRHAGVVGGEVLREAGSAPGVLADVLGSGGARGLHRHA